MKMLSNRLVDSKIELLSGSAVIEATEIGKDTAATIVCKGASVFLKKAGISRFDFEPARLRVFAGEASVELEGRAIQVGAGKMLAFEGEDELKTLADAFTRLKTSIVMLMDMIKKAGQ